MGRPKTNMFPQKRQASPDETVPEGVVSNSTGRAYSTDRLGRYQSHPAADRTFAVTPSHETLENGVRFAVEDVTAMKSDLQQPTLDASALRRARFQETKKYYSSKEQSRYGYRVDYTPKSSGVTSCSTRARGGSLFQWTILSCQMVSKELVPLLSFGSVMFSRTSLGRFEST